MTDIEIAGETLTLCAERAVWWARRRTVFVADVHLGKPAAYRNAGSPVPETVTRGDLDRLAALVGRHEAEALVILGDLAHSSEAWEPTTLGACSRWRQTLAGVRIALVPGNHDARASAPPADLSIELLDETCSLGPFTLCHAPPAEAGEPTLAGHVHPGVVLRDPMRRLSRSVRAPCFLLRGELLVLPAFGAFTGCAALRPALGDRVFAVGPAVVEVRSDGSIRADGSSGGRGAAVRSS